MFEAVTVIGEELHAPAHEIRCATSSGPTGEARVRAADLPPGRYYVVIQSQRGNPAFVSTARGEQRAQLANGDGDDRILVHGVV